MDFIHFNPAYSVLICIRCHFALVPTGIAAHLRIAHASDVSLADRKTAVEAWKDRRDLSQPLVVSNSQSGLPCSLSVLLQ